MQFFTTAIIALLAAVAAAAPLEGAADVHHGSATLAQREAGSPTRPELAKRTDHFGIATFYEQNGAFGSCGQKNSDSSKIIALSNVWQKNQSPGPFCGRKISIQNLGGGDNNNGKGNVVIATVADTCPECDENHLDLSHGAFQALTGGSLDPPGEFNIVWHFCSTSGQC